MDIIRVNRLPMPKEKNRKAANAKITRPTMVKPPDSERSTRGTSVREVCQVVEENGGVVTGVGAIIDRTADGAELPHELVSLARVEVQTWSADDCPLCRDGVALVKPGSRGN